MYYLVLLLIFSTFRWYSKFARPLPRACQITSICVQHEFRHLFQHWFQCLLPFFAAAQSVFRAPISNPVHFFCTNSDECFNCCSNHCFLFEKCAREACLQEPPDLVIVRCLHIGGYLFLKQLFDLVFSRFGSQKRAQKVVKIIKKRSRKTNSKMRVDKVRKSDEKRPPAWRQDGKNQAKRSEG